MHFSPASIRETSFPLATNGYHPDQVDDRLALIADHFADNATVDPDMFACDFELVAAGYDTTKVAEFLADLARVIPTTDTDQPQDTTDDGSVEQADAVGEAVEDVDEADEADQVSLEDDIAVDNEADADDPAPFVDRADEAVEDDAPTPIQPAAVVNSTLPGAVERTRQAVTELEAFVADQMQAAKTALTAQLADTKSDCVATLETARNIAVDALATTRQQVEALIDETQRAGDELRREFDADLSAARASFEAELAERTARIRANLDQVVREAEELTQQTRSRLDSVHNHVSASLKDAETILAPDTTRLAA